MTNSQPPSAYVALKVCRIVRVVRVMKVVRHSKQLGEVMQVVSSASKEFIMLTGRPNKWPLYNCEIYGAMKIQEEQSSVNDSSLLQE